MPSLKTLPPEAPRDEVLAVIAKDGAVILEGMMPEALSVRVEKEMRPHMECSAKGLDEFTGFNTTRTGALVARSPASHDLVLNERVLDCAGAFLKPYCERFQLHLTQMIRLLPGQGSQILHRDRLAWGLTMPREIEPQFNTIWALTEFTEENGATQVVPGSHKWDWERQPTPEETTQAVMKKGSVLLYTGSVIHSGGENKSTGERIGVNITYCLGWLRQEENQYLSCPPKIAKTLEPRLQELLGYTMGSYALGYFSPLEHEAGLSDTMPPEYALGRLPRKAPGFNEATTGFVPTETTAGGE